PTSRRTPTAAARTRRTSWPRPHAGSPPSSTSTSRTCAGPSPAPPRSSTARGETGEIGGPDFLLRSRSVTVVVAVCPRRTDPPVPLLANLRSRALPVRARLVAQGLVLVTVLAGTSAFAL